MFARHCVTLVKVDDTPYHSAVSALGWGLPYRLVAINGLI